MEKNDELKELYKNLTSTEIILHYLGGSEFIKMAGCHSFIQGYIPYPYLIMNIGKNSENINRLKVTRLDEDLFTMEFYLLKKSGHDFKKCNVTILEKLTGSILQETFNRITKLNTHIPLIKKTTENKATTKIKPKGSTL